MCALKQGYEGVKGEPCLVLLQSVLVFAFVCLWCVATLYKCSFCYCGC